MSTYSVFAGGTLIGHSDLELGDPPMGVVLGKFRPTSAYSTIRGACIAALTTGAWDKLELQIRTSNGADVPAQGGVMILDAPELAENEIEVQAAGISYPLYAQLFAAHVLAYESRNA